MKQLAASQPSVDADEPRVLNRTRSNPMMKRHNLNFSELVEGEARKAQLDTGGLALNASYASSR